MEPDRMQAAEARLIALEARMVDIDSRLRAVEATSGAQVAPIAVSPPVHPHLPRSEPRVVPPPVIPRHWQASPPIPERPEPSPRPPRDAEYLIGAKMEYHFEHHLLPTIPYHGLKKLHRCLRARGFFDRLSRGDRARALSGGYLHFARHFEEPVPTADVHAA